MDVSISINISKNIVKTIAGFLDCNLLILLLSPVIFLFAFSSAHAVVASVVSVEYNTKYHEFSITAQPLTVARYTMQHTTPTEISQSFESGEKYHFTSNFTLEKDTLVLESKPLSQNEVSWIDNKDGSFTWKKAELNQTLVASTQITGPVFNKIDAGRRQYEDRQVLGVNTGEPTEPGEIASGITDNNLLGSVLGASTENCSVPSSWWMILAIYLIILILIHAMFAGRFRTIAHLLAALITAGALYKVLCMPWFWIAIVLILAVLSETLPWLLSQNTQDSFAKTFEKNNKPKSYKRK